MPPKAKVTIPTKDEFHALNEKLQSKPVEADYKQILAGAKGDDEIKVMTARIIPQYYKEFPKSQKDALEALKTLAGDANADVQIWAVRGLKDNFVANEDDVAKVVYTVLGSENATVSDAAKKIVSDAFSNEEFAKTFTSQIKDQTPAAQAKMIAIATEKITFTEETVEQLLSVIESALNCAVEEGLILMSKNKKIIPEEKRVALVNQLLDNLDASLDSQFDEVVDSLLVTILKFGHSFGQLGRLYNIVADKVLPKFEQVPIDKKIRIVQLVADNAQNAEDAKILEQLYNNVYLKFPVEVSEDTKINFSLLEATLYAFYNLAKKFPRKASELNGILLFITGQPGENDGISEDAEKKNQFRARLNGINTVAKSFVDHYKAKKASLEEHADIKTNTELKEERRQTKIAIRTGNNVLHFCRILKEDNYIHQKPPADVSWRAPKLKKFNKKGPKGPKGNQKNKKNFNKGGNRRNERRGRNRGDNRRRK